MSFSALVLLSPQNSVCGREEQGVQERHFLGVYGESSLLGEEEKRRTTGNKKRAERKTSKNQKSSHQLRVDGGPPDQHGGLRVEPHRLVDDPRGPPQLGHVVERRGAVLVIMVMFFFKARGRRSEFFFFSFDLKPLGVLPPPSPPPTPPLPHPPACAPRGEKLAPCLGSVLPPPLPLGFVHWDSARRDARRVGAAAVCCLCCCRPKKKNSNSKKHLTHPEHLVHLPRHLLGVLRPRDQAVDGPRQHRGGGLVPGDQQRHQVVAQLLRVERVARGEQKVEDRGVLVREELVDKLLLARVDEALALGDEAVEGRVDDGEGLLAAALPRDLVFVFFFFFLGGGGSSSEEKM